MVGYSGLERRGREKYLDKAVLAGRGYVRRGFLGQGTFSDVYCVEDGSGRLYACKVSEQAEMLEREARAMEGLSHPLFPRYADFWRRGSLGILMREYVPGSCLEELLGRRRFSVEQTVRVGLLLADGLGYLHKLPKRLLFRDVKPANIIIRQDGGVMLIDFGCVCSMEEKVTSRAGSPGFAAPEQLSDGGVLTASCDVYGLGRTLEAMLGGAEGRSRRNPRSGGYRTGLLETGPCRGKAWPEEAEGISCRCGRTGLRKAGKGRRWGTWQERRMRRELLRVLEACTEEEARKRIGDMDEVVRELGEIGEA